MFTNGNIKECREEIRRLLRAFDSYEEAVKEDERYRIKRNEQMHNSGGSPDYARKYGLGGRESAAVRRASMDVTRALARLRKA